MPKEINFQLLEAGMQEIVEAIKRDGHPEVRQRAMGFCFLREGKAPNETVEKTKSGRQERVKRSNFPEERGGTGRTGSK